METTQGLVVWKPQSQNWEESPRAGGQERELGKEGHRGTQPGMWAKSFLDSKVGGRGGGCGGAGGLLAVLQMLSWLFGHGTIFL